MSGEVTALSDGIEPFSLYLDLEAGRLADLEVVARISLALSAAIREAAFIIDPSISIRIELLSGTEGSFSLNTFIKSLKPKDALARINLKSLAAACFLWFGGQSAEYTYEKVLDHFLAAPQLVVLSQQDKQDIANQVYNLLSKHIAEDQVHGVYRALNADPAIKAVGATAVHGARPAHLIPRSEFLSRAGVRHESELELTTRTRETEVILTLISPVLLEDSPRRWRVRGPEGEFGASVKDDTFLKSLAHGRTRVPMVSDIRMVVILETKEDLKNDVWEIKERNILKVLRVIEPVTQESLDLMPRAQPTGDGKTDPKE